MEQVELKPCPFCGDEACEALRETFEGNLSRGLVFCGNCGSETAEHDGLAEAIEAWNTRTNDQAKDEEIARYRAALEAIVHGEIEEHDEDIGGKVWVSLDEDDCAELARKALGASDA